jgi:hypothetical protein
MQCVLVADRVFCVYVPSLYYGCTLFPVSVIMRLIFNMFLGFFFALFAVKFWQYIVSSAQARGQSAHAEPQPTMELDNHGMSLVQLVYGWTAAIKVQKAWRGAWRERTTSKLIALYFASYSRERFAGLMCVTALYRFDADI